ncbi:MAG: hypothetical protein AB7G25_04350 [Sphingomonadaceae bacterium]|jgi:nitric oxide reductase large subunit
MRGQFVVSAADIRASQQVFFTYGPQRRDLGNGGYLEPDFAASHVHAWALAAVDDIHLQTAWRNPSVEIAGRRPLIQY